MALRQVLAGNRSGVRQLVRVLIPIQRWRNKIEGALHAWNTGDAEREPMDPELRRQLVSEFTPEVQELGKLINRDLSHWVNRGQPATV